MRREPTGARKRACTPLVGVAAQSSGSERSSNSTSTTTTVEHQLVHVPRGRSAELKHELYQLVRGLDRGLAANAAQAQAVTALVSSLIDAAGPVDLASSADQLQGMWRLLYTSGFNSGSLGGRRPGPPPGLVPAKLGEIYQRIDRPSGKLDNIVEFTPALPLPPFLGDGGSPPSLRLTLGHDYEVQAPCTVEICFEDTAAEVVGGPSVLAGVLPRLQTPQLPEVLRPPRGLRSATFEVQVLDEELRVTKGDRGELRIYIRELSD